MKKRLTALLTAILCMTAAVSAVPASAVDVTVNPYYTIDTESFTYVSKYIHEGFYLESELADPDFLVVGIEYSSSNPDEVWSYIVSSIAKPDSPCQGVGRILNSTLQQEIGDIELHVGDLLKFDGGYVSADISPTYYTLDPESPATVTYLGNGVDIYGEEFERVIRMQMIIDGVEFVQETSGSIYGINIKWGDVDADYDISILDCISLNKNLLGGLELCDYAKIVSDVNNDGILDSTDSLAILKEVVGLTVNYEPVVD